MLTRRIDSTLVIKGGPISISPEIRPRKAILGAFSQEIVLKYTPIMFVYYKATHTLRKEKVAKMSRS